MTNDSSAVSGGGGTPEGGPTLRGSWDAQVDAAVLVGEVSGPAGVVDVEPVPGVVLSFDAASLGLCEVVVETKSDGELGWVDPAARELCDRLFGAEWLERLRVGLSTGRSEIDIPISGDGELLRGLARLACAEAAQGTDPLSPTSPLWDAEQAALADELGLEVLARRHAGRVVERLVGFVAMVPDALRNDRVRRALDAVSRLAAATAPEPARVIAGALRGELEQPEHFDIPRGPAPLEVDPDAPLSLVLDAAVLPERTFLFGADPSQDAAVREEDGILAVWVRLHPWARRSIVEGCRARVVDRETRRVLAETALSREGSVAHAVFRFEGARHEGVALEIVESDQLPVASNQFARHRMALRFADSALRAERRPRPLHPGWTGRDWAEEAARLWRESAAAWRDAGDETRAAQAEWCASRAGEAGEQGAEASMAFLAEIFFPTAGETDPAAGSPTAEAVGSGGGAGEAARGNDALSPEDEAAVLAFRGELESFWWLLPLGAEPGGPWEVRAGQDLVGAGRRGVGVERPVGAGDQAAVAMNGSTLEVDLGPAFAGARVELRSVASGPPLQTVRLDEGGRAQLALPRDVARHPLRLAVVAREVAE